jgi:Flavin-binding monooxygenase-like
LQGVCEKYEIVDKIQLNTEVKECIWNQSEGVWDITMCHLSIGLGDLSTLERQQRVDQHGHQSVYLRDEKIKAKVLVSAVGGLVEPKTWPDHIPGKEVFQGEIFHSARWKYDVDLKDKDVIVVGTGCSAAQFLPKLTTEYGAKSVTQIMRSPPWVVPRPGPPNGEQWWREWGPWLCNNIPGYQQAIRTLFAAGSEWDWRLFGMGEWSKKHRATLETQLLDHMKKHVPQKYWEIMTPNYGVGCMCSIVISSSSTTNRINAYKNTQANVEYSTPSG